MHKQIGQARQTDVDRYGQIDVDRCELTDVRGQVWINKWKRTGQTERCKETSTDVCSIDRYKCMQTSVSEICRQIQEGQINV